MKRASPVAPDPITRESPNANAGNNVEALRRADQRHRRPVHETAYEHRPIQRVANRYLDGCAGGRTQQRPRDGGCAACLRKGDRGHTRPALATRIPLRLDHLEIEVQLAVHQPSGRNALVVRQCDRQRRFRSATPRCRHSGDEGQRHEAGDQGDPGAPGQPMDGRHPTTPRSVIRIVRQQEGMHLPGGDAIT